MSVKLNFSWTEYFLLLARVVASRSKCYKRNVGCVIVKDKRILATGYVGGFSKEPECVSKGYCVYEVEYNKDPKFCKAIHAEMNALLQCVQFGISVKGATLYCTLEPCVNCLMHIAQSGIKEVIYEKPYDNTTRETKQAKEYLLNRIKNSVNKDFKLIHYPLDEKILELAKLIFTPEFLEKNIPKKDIKNNKEPIYIEILD